MAVHIDQVISEVVPEPEIAGSSSAGEGSTEWWDDVDHIRGSASRLTRDRLRTRAEGFDD